MANVARGARCAWVVATVVGCADVAGRGAGDGAALGGDAADLRGADAGAVVGDASAGWAGDAVAMSDGAGSDAEAPTAQVVALVARSCVTGYCHAGSIGHAPESEGAARSAVQFLRDALDAPARHAPRRRLIVPYEPDQSYLVQKLDGTFADLPECRAASGTAASCGARMPLGGPAVGGAEIALVRGWIARGAPLP
jgi:hypothetical protein